MRTIKRSSVFGIAVIPLLALAAGCGSSGGGGGSLSGGTKSTIVIGTTIPLSGVAGPVCRPISDAATAWFDHINAEGGINGRMIEQKILDDQYQAPLALANAKKLSQAGVFAIFGGCGTIQPPAVESIAGPANIPYLFPNASVPSLKSSANAYLLLPTYDQQLPGLIKYAVPKFGAGTAYAVVGQVPGSDAVINAVRDTASAVGVDMVGESLTTPGQADLSSVILKIKEAKPDYLILADGVNALRLFQGLAAQNALPAKKILGYSAAAQAVANAGAGVLPDGMFLAASAVAAPNSPEMKTCDDVTNSASPNSANNPDVGYSCAAAQALTTALQEAGPDLTRDSFNKVLLGWQSKDIFPGLTPLSFTSDDRVGEHSMFVLTLQKGALESTGTLPLD